MLNNAAMRFLVGTLSVIAKAWKQPKFLLNGALAKIKYGLLDSHIDME